MVKRILTFLFVIFLLFFCVLTYLMDYPRNITFSCSKKENVCTYSASYLFKRKEVETIEFNKIVMSRIVQNVFEKSDDISRYATSTLSYNYDWVVYYRDNGKIEKFNVFRTSDYESSPAYELLDKEYRYYVDLTKMFNSFLEDKSKSSIYIPEYSDNSAKEQDFWRLIFIASFIFAQAFVYAYIIIGLAIAGLEGCMPEGKIKQILKYIAEKLTSWL